MLHWFVGDGEALLDDIGKFERLVHDTKLAFTTSLVFVADADERFLGSRLS